MAQMTTEHWKMVAQVRRHNADGARAITADDLMPAEASHNARVKPRGKGKWKAWLPPAIAHAAFAPASVSCRVTAKQMKKSHAQVAHAKHLTA